MSPVRCRARTAPSAAHDVASQNLAAASRSQFRREVGEGGLPCRSWSANFDQVFEQYMNYYKFQKSPMN